MKFGGVAVTVPNFNQQASGGGIVEIWGGGGDRPKFQPAGLGRWDSCVVGHGAMGGGLPLEHHHPANELHYIALGLNLLRGVALCRWGSDVRRRIGSLRADGRARKQKAYDEGEQAQVRLLLGAFLKPDELSPGEH